VTNVSHATTGTPKAWTAETSQSSSSRSHVVTYRHSSGWEKSALRAGNVVDLCRQIRENRTAGQSRPVAAVANKTGKKFRPRARECRGRETDLKRSSE
jgi:hypothetical protein